MDGEQINNNLKQHIIESSYDKKLNPELGANFSRKEDSVIEPLFARGAENTIFMEDSRFLGKN